GLDSNGVRDVNLPVLIDMDNFIDYMLLTFWVGNFDAPLSNFLSNDRPNNYFSIYDRTNNDRGFAFFAHDAEHSLFSGWDRTGPFNSSNRSVFAYSNPQFLHEDLFQNLDTFSREEYLIAWADRAHKALFNGGVLTSTKAAERINARANIVDQAIVAESARWGDAKGANPPHDRNDWIGAKNSLLGIASGRTAALLGQLQADGLYPGTEAPVLSQHGGQISSSTELSISNNGGVIYYTTDGTDPRLIGGAVSPSASIYTGSTNTTTLVASGSSWKYLDDGSNQGTAWRSPIFNDTGWATGTAELGYGDGGEATAIGFGPDEDNKFITSYFRKTFNATGASNFTSAVLELQRDDGAVVYLNGTEIARSNMPGGTVAFNTFAAGVAGGADETTFFNIAIPPSSIVEGSNTLAVEVHQVSAGSSDTSFDLRLRATETTTANPLFLTDTGPVMTRALDGGDWSAVTEANFIVDAAPADSGNLVITEIHYRPAPPTPAEEDAGFIERSDFEFIELMNIGDTDLDMTNVRFTAGVGFDFDESSLGIILSPGQRVLLVNDLAGFQLRYPAVPLSQIAGEFSGSLSNGGERLTLLATDNLPIRNFTYNDKSPWPESADGDGFSLTLISPEGNPDHADPFSWRPSVGVHGSPGISDAVGFIGSPLADADGDDVVALIEYLLGTSDGISSAEAMPTAQAQTITVDSVPGNYLTIELRVDLAADDVDYEIEISDDLSTWLSGSGEVEFVSRTNNGDGTATLIYRSATDVPTEIRHFIRLNATLK
ncbi:MAG: chitobiase/beta-hexosaminidase C-terminal domain-containing protein, partial [Verrucomicrobiales bacterium]